MWSFWRRLPNLITAVRLLMVPLLWIMALNGRTFALAVGLGICGVSDWLDGFVARRLNQTSSGGAKLDSLADNLLLVSAVIWVLMLRPAIFLDNWVAVCVALAIYLLSILVGFIKFGRIANLHLTLAKISGYVLYPLIIFVFLMEEQYSPWLFWPAWLIAVLSAGEALIIQLISPQVDEHMGSLVSVLRRRKIQASETAEVSR